MAGVLLSTFTKREEAHAELDLVLKAGNHPMAECRDNPAYSVWDGPADPYNPEFIPLPDTKEKIQEDLIESKIASAVLVLLTPKINEMIAAQLGKV